MGKIYAAKTNHITNPVGFYMEQIVFSWKVKECEGKKQKNARILISKEKDFSEILFDTKEAELDSCGTKVNFQTAPYTRYYWKVIVTTDQGEVVGSDVQFFETAKQDEQITTEQRDSLWSLTDQYVYKNADLLKNYFTDQGEVVSAEYILNNIELEGSGDKAQTTYDGLVLKLVSLEQQVAASQIDRQFQEEILQSFRNVDFGGTDEQHAAMESMINDYEAQLKSYYEIINTSSKELNLYISADYLKMISSVQVAAAINVKLYLMLALVLFFVIGCCGAVLLGRLSDVVDYLLYVDKKTGLPNREKLNVYITGMAGRILPEDYTCFAFQLDNLTEMSRRFGYTVGDGILKDFSGLLQLMGDTDGTVGYNGAGKFLAFFDECSSRKAEVMIRILQSQVDEYNKLNPEYPILFTAAWATTSEEELYHVRDLVRCAQKKMALTAEEGGAALGISET